MYTPEELFQRWYAEPLKRLEEIPRGDGRFVALAVSCALYERFATAILKRSGVTADKSAKIQRCMQDFDPDEQTARAFWTVVRDGLAHQAMPKHSDWTGDQPEWWLHHDYPKAAELADINGRTVLKVQPWVFMHKVLGLWHDNLDLLTASRSFPWGNIVGM